MIRLDKRAATYITYLPVTTFFIHGYYLRSEIVKGTRRPIVSGFLWVYFIYKNEKNGTYWGSTFDPMHAKCTERYGTLCVANGFARNVWHCALLFSLTLGRKAKVTEDLYLGTDAARWFIPAAEVFHVDKKHNRFSWCICHNFVGYLDEDLAFTSRNISAIPWILFNIYYGRC